MSGPVAQSLEALNRELSRRLSTINAWSSPSAGFCARVLQIGRAEGQWVTAPEKWSAADTPQDEAPGLAVIGYRLATGFAKADPAVVAKWEDGMGRLKERDPLPRDRQTFLHRPVELLGIILGSKATGLSTDWIKEALQKRPWPAHTDPFLSTIYAWVGHLVAAPIPLGFTNAAETSIEALAILILLLREGALGKPVGLYPSSLAEIQDLFLQRLLDGTPADLDECRHAALLVGLRMSRADRLSAELQAAGNADRSLRDVLLLLEHIARRFEHFTRQLNKRYDSRPGFAFGDEYDVQDAFHAVLRLHFEDVRPEEHTPSVAGKHGRLDFLLPRHRVAVETKMTRKGLGRAELLRELGEDTIRFKKHPDVEYLFCFVYDPGRFCDNPAAVESDLSSNVNHPKIHVVVSSR